MVSLTISTSPVSLFVTFFKVKSILQQLNSNHRGAFTAEAANNTINACKYPFVRRGMLTMLTLLTMSKYLLIATATVIYDEHVIKVFVMGYKYGET